MSPGSSVPLVENHWAVVDAIVGCWELRNGLLDEVAPEWRPGGQWQELSEGKGAATPVPWSSTCGWSCAG